MEKLEHDDKGAVLKEKLLVSACLIGVRVRYDGGDSRTESILRLEDRYDLIPLCPEVLGGLPVPRPPAEILLGKAVTEEGRDVTVNFEAGARITLDYCLENGIRKAILKSKSPSCGTGMIYDGSFTRTLTPGDGFTAELLRRHGIEVYSENNFMECV
ncbi:MAG TPA: DUF523 domain-containing protein [Clostridiaceae bacterium]|nr:DUF523 domain-containing protein [Clostridiaceae bacterium]